MTSTGSFMGGAANPEHALALSYAPRQARTGLTALLELDRILAETLRRTREPLVAQMRLTWWFDALCALDTAPPPAQPLLEALASEVLSHGITGAQLAGMIDGWEVLLDPDPLGRELLEAYAAQRGATLFRLGGLLLGASGRDMLDVAGAGWALADLAARSRDAGEAARARPLALAALDDAMARRWSTAARALGALALSARMDLAGKVPHGAPRRVARLAWHRLSGR